MYDRPRSKGYGASGYRRWAQGGVAAVLGVAVGCGYYIGDPAPGDLDGGGEPRPDASPPVPDAGPPAPDAGPPDWAPEDPLRCSDLDFDGCDDCSGGTADPSADGTDADADGRCDRPLDFQPAPTIVAVSASGGLAYSADGGTTWTASANSRTWPDLRSVAAGLGRFYAVGAGERMLRSNNGVTWTEVLVPFPTGAIDFEVVTYVGSGEWAVGGADATGSRVLVSYDHGLTWEDAGSPFGPGSTVTGLALHRDTGRWVAVGAPGDRIAYATRGVSARLGAWSEAAAIGGLGGATGAGFADVVHHRGGWTAVGPAGNAARSIDHGFSWTRISPLCEGQPLTAIVAGNMQAVAVGGAGCATESGTGADREWMVSSTAPALAAGPAMLSAYFDLGLDAVFAGNARGEIGVSADGGATWTKAATEGVFTSADAIVGLAGEPTGAVRAEVFTGSANATCPISLAGMTRRLERFIPDMNIPTNGDGKPKILGVQSLQNGGARLRAGVRVTTAGDYAFRVRIGAGDAVEALVDGTPVVACGGASSAPIALGPDTVAELVVQWADDGFRDAIVVEYNGPDTRGAWAVIPQTAFVRAP